MPEIELNNILNKHNNIKKEAKDKKNMWKKRPPVMHKEGARPR